MPNIKLKVDSHSHTQPVHTHVVYHSRGTGSPNGYIDADGQGGYRQFAENSEPAGGENTGTASPYTEALGNGTALSIQPAYITLKFWKRLT